MENKQTGVSGNKKNVIEELNLDNFKSTMRRDFKELKEFFLDDERLHKLEDKKPLERGFSMAWLLFKALFLKLTNARRVLLIIALILLVINISGTIGQTNIRFDNFFKILGGLVLLFILMLELKDKLLAHDELAAGRQVQLALMPESSPKIPGWDVWLYSMPANDVGGDLVDFIQLGENRFGLVLGDVAGKGLPAALFMAKLQATLRALVTEFDSMADLGAKINRIFHRDSIAKSFASLVYLELNPRSGHINFLNAGHLPPLVLRDGKVESTEKGNLGLGILASAPYKAKKARLKRGDLFIVYSDGVSEAQSEAEEFFGNERLFKLLSEMKDPFVSEVGAKILEAVDKFAGEAPRHDDLSLLILKRR
ncbi:MAG: serine/threonine-protein phosphatase [Candidatus Aminicenantes bacterium]|nr:serine/threonine-protein phosphatase [Candidatus Aminicenantes bacterium]